MSDQEQALIIKLAGSAFQDPANSVQQVRDLEKELAAAIGKLGELDGHEFELVAGAGVQGATIFFYGADAEAMLSAIEPIMLTHVLAAKSSVIARKGTPGAADRTVTFQSNDRGSLH